MVIIPQIDNALTELSTSVPIPSKTYKLNFNVITTINESGSTKVVEADKIAGFVDNIEAVKQAIYHILMTERYRYIIYGDNYGVELEQYIGKDFSYLEATIENTLQEALTQDLRITNVSVTNIEKINNDTALVKFKVTSIYGDLLMEVNLNV